jgi:hypothetical protein
LLLLADLSSLVSLGVSSFRVFSGFFEWLLPDFFELLPPDFLLDLDFLDFSSVVNKSGSLIFLRVVPFLEDFTTNLLFCWPISLFSSFPELTFDDPGDLFFFELECLFFKLAGVLLDFSGVALSAADLSEEGLEKRVLVPLVDVLDLCPSDASEVLFRLYVFVVAFVFLAVVLSSSSDENAQVAEPLLSSDMIAFVLVLGAATAGRRFLCDSEDLVFLLAAVLFVPTSRPSVSIVLLLSRPPKSTFSFSFSLSALSACSALN